MDPRLHPSVYIHPSARLGQGVIIYPNVTIWQDVRIGDYSVIGGMPEHRDFYDDTWDVRSKGVVIGKGARIFEFVSIHAGTQQQTSIGEGASIQNHTHIGHDSDIGERALIGGTCTIAGHVKVMAGATVGGRSAVHQHCVIGCLSILSAASFLKSHIPPGEKWIGNPARPAGINDIGLSRAKMSHQQVLDLYLTEYESLMKESKL